MAAPTCGGKLQGPTSSGTPFWTRFLAGGGVASAPGSGIWRWWKWGRLIPDNRGQKVPGRETSEARGPSGVSGQAQGSVASGRGRHSSGSLLLCHLYFLGR